MRIIYLANIRFPNEKAHGKHVREMCNALATITPVTLVVPGRKTEGDPREFGLDTAVEFVPLHVPDAVRFGRFGFLFTAVCFALASALYVFRRRNDSVVLTREYLCAIIPALCGVRTAWESHRGEWNIAIRLALRCGARLVVITKGLRDFYESKGVAPEKILVAPDGVDLARYEQLEGISREQARVKVGLPLEKKIAIYNGHLHTWKGAGTLAEAACFLPDDVQVIFMGGTDEDIAVFKEQYGNDSHVRIIGRKSDSERPFYLRAADVAVLPNTAKDEISVKYTSPLKLFGYMAAGVPIVASDLPSIREVLDNDTALWFRADDAPDLARAIRSAFDDPSHTTQIGDRAQKSVQRYSWEERGKHIVDFLQT